MTQCSFSIYPQLPKLITSLPLGGPWYNHRSEGLTPNGIFGPWAWWSRALARWESCWDVAVAAAAAAVAAAVSWKLGSETVLVFGPESVSYERSRRENRTILREILARVFFVKIPKYRKKLISNISRIWENQKKSNISRIWGSWKTQICNISRIWGIWKNQISNISRLIDNVADFNFQYFQDRNN